MMRAVLADMALEVEGALAAVMRLCRSFDLASSVPAEAARARLLTPAIKYWVCKAAPALVYEAMECLGGNGYVEDCTLARLYREAPVNAIWEGSGNVMGLDVLRAFARDAEAARATLADLARRSGRSARRGGGRESDRKDFADGAGEGQRARCRRTARATCGGRGAQCAARAATVAESFRADAAVGAARRDLRHQRSRRSRDHVAACASAAGFLNLRIRCRDCAAFFALTPSCSEVAE